jgi:Na+/proline symporter
MSADHPKDTNHGDTVAAWTSVVVIIIGFAGMTGFFYLGDTNLTYVSIAVIIVGAILGPVLSMLGFGKKR